MREISCASQKGRRKVGSGLFKESLMFTEFIKKSWSNTIRDKRENKQTEIKNQNPST